MLILNRSGYLNTPSSQLQVLIITFGTLVSIVSMDAVILPLNLQFATLNVLILIPLCLVGILLSFAFELIIGFFLRKKYTSNYSMYATTAAVRQHPESTKEGEGDDQRLNSRINKTVFHIILIGIGVMEEIIFRGVVLQYVLSMGVPLILSLTISSVAFGVNHFFRSPVTVIQKSAAGAIFGILAYQSGFSLSVPIIVHVVENYLILLFGRFKNQIFFSKNKK